MSTTVTEPSPTDSLVRYGSKVVLAIESDLAKKLRGKSIDIEQTDDGRRALMVL